MLRHGLPSYGLQAQAVRHAEEICRSRLKEGVVEKPHRPVTVSRQDVGREELIRDKCSE